MPLKCGSMCESVTRKSVYLFLFQLYIYVGCIVASVYFPLINPRALQRFALLSNGVWQNRPHPKRHYFFLICFPLNYESLFIYVLFPSVLHTTCVLTFRRVFLQYVMHFFLNRLSFNNRMVGKFFWTEFQFRPGA